MSQETEALLRIILYNASMTDSIDEVRDAIRVMCSKETVATVEQQVAESKKRKEKNV
jgi:hypothetical protein